LSIRFPDLRQSRRSSRASLAGHRHDEQRLDRILEAIDFALRTMRQCLVETTASLGAASSARVLTNA
jgi:hypothetical protein